MCWRNGGMWRPANIGITASCFDIGGEIPNDQERRRRSIKLLRKAADFNVVIGWHRDFPQGNRYWLPDEAEW